MSLPNKDELAEIRRAAKDTGALPKEAEAAAVEAFSKGEFTTEGVDSWFSLQFVQRPELWRHIDPAVAALDAEHGVLAREAFEGKGSPGARSKLVKAVGEATAGSVAKEYGL